MCPERTSEKWRRRPDLNRGWRFADFAGLPFLTAGPAFRCGVLSGSASCLGASVLELFSNHTSEPSRARSSPSWPVVRLHHGRRRRSSAILAPSVDTAALPRTDHTAQRRRLGRISQPGAPWSDRYSRPVALESRLQPDPQSRARVSPLRASPDRELRHRTAGSRRTVRPGD